MTGPEPGTQDHRFLWLLRHAKAVPDPPSGGTDHERPLAPRGRRDADALGRRLGPGGDLLGLPTPALPTPALPTPALPTPALPTPVLPTPVLPTLVLCSTAERTTQTAVRVLASWPAPARPPVDRRRALYGASPEQVLEVLGTVPDDVISVMVVGHNPTVHALAGLLPSNGEDRPFSTGGLAVYRFGIGRWEDVAEGTACELGRFAPPY
ncbi:MAG: SixA phosphatase family protein [Acidimicrobiales bacterium]